MADLAVIVVSANSGRWLRPCLDSVFARAGGAALDVVVVDAECTDDTAAAVAEFPAARLLPVENRGFAYGNNRAFLATSAVPSDEPFSTTIHREGRIVCASSESASRRRFSSSSRAGVTAAYVGMRRRYGRARVGRHRRRGRNAYTEDE